VREHRATREAVTLCDVSHMGEFEFRARRAGAGAENHHQRRGKLAVNQALYSTMCDERGILLDDLVCFRSAADHFVWVVNVTKTDDDYQWVLKHAAGWT
jgi:aminomethyltransferase